MAHVLVRATDGLLVRMQPLAQPRGVGEAWPDFVWIEAADDWAPPVAPPPTPESTTPTQHYLDLDSLGKSPTAKKLDAALGTSPFECIDQKAKREQRPDEVSAYKAHMLARGKLQALQSEADQIRAKSRASNSEYLRIKAEQKAQAKEIENAPKVAELSLAVDAAKAAHDAERLKP